MRKIILLLFCALLTQTTFSQIKCDKPEFPKWDKECYPHIGGFVQSQEVKSYFTSLKDYLACQQLKARADTNQLPTRYKPSLAEFKKEINFDKINLKDITREDAIKWTKDNVFTNIELSFGGFISRPKDFADLTIPDDYVYSFGIKKKASESCVTCPENVFGRKEEELKKDEENVTVTASVVG